MTVRDRMGKLLGQVDHLAHDMIEFSKHVAKTGQIVAAEQKITNRIIICGNCDKFNGRSCSVCGCNMKIKVVMDSSCCPIGKWK
jgi:hypothetical protein